MNVNVKGSCVDVTDFKCSAFCNLRVFNEGHRFDTSAGMVINSNRFGMTIVASPNHLCLISMKHVRQLVGDFGIEKNILSNFLRREIELNYCPNFLDLSCDEDYIAVAGTSNSNPSITIYNVEALISQSYIFPLICIDLAATQGSYVVDMSWNPSVQSSLACCLSDGSLHIIELKDSGTYTTVSLPPQSSTLCLSWSPKGKQIVIGSSNGSLTQYKPELKAVKQYLPPTDIAANVKPIKVKWISNFQFAVTYDFIDNTDEQPSIYILNTPKNAPVEFINFEQYVIMNSEQYRLNQYYMIFQQNWSVLFVASSNCSEIGVMGINNENQWQCWMLETRPELPYRLDKQMYPLGMSLDLSSQMQIKQMSKSNEEIFIDPMPVLCVLSSDGILFMYHIENQLTDYKNICKPPSEVPENILAQIFTTDSKIHNTQGNEQIIVTEVVEQIDEINVFDKKAKGDHNESVLASYLEISTTSQVEEPQILDTPKVSLVKPNIPSVSIATISPMQNVPTQSNFPDKSTSIDEIMLNGVLEDVNLFQSELKEVLKLSLETSKLKIGDEKDKETLVKKWTSLDLFFKELNETNRSQWAENKSLQKAVLDSIAWVEDSKSRLFFLKNPKYKCLLKNDSDEPFSKTLFDHIERTLYYIETQLRHVDDQLKARYNSYNSKNKELKIPCLETIYKSLVVNTNIVNKLKEKLNCLNYTVGELKHRAFKKLSLAPDVVQNTSRLHESRDVGLSKLSEQLLKITLDKDGVSAINSYNVAKKYSVLSANQRALSDSKVNKLQEWLKDFKTRRTKITRSKYPNVDISRPVVCSTPLKSTSKQKVDEKNNEFTPIITKENVAFALPQNPLLDTNYNANEKKVLETKSPLITNPSLMQLKKPLFISTTQKSNTSMPVPITISPVTTAFSSGSQPLPTSTIITPIWSPMDNTSTPKPVSLNDLSNKFNYNVFTKDPMVFSSANTTLVGNNGGVSSKDPPIDFSLKSSTSTPLNFSNTFNVVSTKSTVDVISGTTESKEKIPFDFTSVSTVKTETTIPKTNMSMIFNFADSIKNKMDTPSLSTVSFEPSKALSKPLETPVVFSGLSTEDKLKNKHETVPVKDSITAAFNFNSKPDTTLFSTFSFTAPKNDISKMSAAETKLICTSTTATTTVTASFNFSLPAVNTEPSGSTVSSTTFGVVKTTSVFSTVPATTTNSSVIETTPQVSDSPTPIISEPVTPESENVPTTLVTTNNAPIFEIPSTSTSIFGTPNNTSTTSIFGSSISTTCQTSIFNTSTNVTSASSIFNMPTNSNGSASIFNTPTNTNSATSIFSTPTNTTSPPSIFNTSTNTINASTMFGSSKITTTNSTPSVFGTPTNATTTSSLFGTPTNGTSTSSIFGVSNTTTSSSIFGNSLKTTTSSIFGAPAPTTVSSMFGSATTTNTTSGFGSPAQTTTVFGSPATTNSSIFGNPSAATSSSSIFGSASTTTSSIFGAPASTSTTSSIFGTSSTTATSSGLFGSVAAAANQPSSFGQTSLGFSSPGSAFSNMSLFGQQACSPSQPANSFAPSANPFAVNKTPSSTPSLFSNQKTVFGQPAANSNNTGFGVANSGFGATAATGFSSPAMGGQSSNLSFGTSPMFGSMGTAYDMSKSSGFGQAPVFGGAATFGSSTPTQYTFGQNPTPESGSFGFGSAAQQPSTAFASLAAQNNTSTFGNLAQSQNTGFASPTTAGFGQQQQQQQTSPFKPQGATFGGSSFSSWR